MASSRREKKRMEDAIQQSAPTIFPEGHMNPRCGERVRAAGKGYDCVTEEVELRSDLGGSEMDSGRNIRNSRKSFEQTESVIDRMEQCKSILSELLSKKDEPFSDGVTKELSSVKTQNKGKHGHALNGSFPLFLEKINGLAKSDKKRLKHTFNETIAFLNANVDEVDRDVQAMVKSGETCQDNVKEFSADLLGKLDKMAQSVEDLLNTSASRCRPMTTEEKIELSKRIRKLPEESLNRVVEIVTAGKPERQSSEKLTFNMGDLDDATLWRLYYHVEYVLKKNNV